jgi:nitroreductase
MSFLDLAHERFSCRKFDTSRPVEQEKIDKIVEAAMAAPTACNLQPFKLWVMNDESNIKKLSDATPYIFGAKTVMIVGADKFNSYVRKFDNKNFAKIDASIVATHIMLEVQDLGLGTTWVGYFDPAVLKELFPQMSGYEIVAIFPIGYPASDVEIAEMHYKSKAKEDLVTVL